MNRVLWILIDALPSPLRHRARLSLLRPHSRDAEFASALQDDGGVDPTWAEEECARRGLPTSTTVKLSLVPRLVTPETIKAARKMPGLTAQQGFGSPSVIARLERRMDLDQRRFPQLFARRVSIEGRA